jgi:NAD(P)-dependent dehydrogenase (short-subunit alcohol dehydrogenase family)
MSGLQGAGNMKLENKVAIVTGGGKGIGKAIVGLFASEGAAVLICGRTEADLRLTASEIKAAAGQVEYLVADMASPPDIMLLVAFTMERFGKIDILVNNAAVGGPTAKFVDISLPDWNNVMAVNLTGPMLCTQAVLKHMLQARSGNIINIVSEGGRSGFPLRCPYAVSKRGLIALTETVAIEAGEYNIRVNCISPGRVRGERVENVCRDKSKVTGLPFDEVVAGLMQDASLKRLIEPAEVAAAALFLASDDSSAITGQTLPVNCGKHILH